MMGDSSSNSQGTRQPAPEAGGLPGDPLASASQQGEPAGPSQLESNVLGLLRGLNQSHALEVKKEGNVLFRKGDWEGACSCYTASILAEPTAAAYSNRAAARLKLGNWEAVVLDCTAALRLDSGTYKALVRRCDALIALSKPNAALADLRELYATRPLEVAEFPDREAKAIKIRAVQIAERQKAGQSGEACGFCEDVAWLNDMHKSVPEAHEMILRMDLLYCARCLRPPCAHMHPDLSYIATMCRMHAPTLLNRIRVLLEAQSGRRAQPGFNPAADEVLHALLGAVIDEHLIPAEVLDASPGLLPFCLTYSLVDPGLKEEVATKFSSKLRPAPGCDVYDFLVKQDIEVASKTVPVVLMCVYLGNFMARCVGTLAVWSRSPGVQAYPVEAVQHPLACKADRLAMLRRLCELWADPLARVSCGKALIRPICALCRLFLGDDGVTPPGEPEWDIILTHPGFLAALGDSGCYVGTSYRHIHTFMMSLSAERWQRVADDQILVVFMRCHAACLERVPLFYENGETWKAAEYKQLLTSLDRMLATPERRFFVLTELYFMSPFVGSLAAQAGLTKPVKAKDHPGRKYVLISGVPASNCTEPLSTYACVWVKKKHACR